MKITLFGPTGMVGSHLADYILDHHPAVEVHGLIRWRSPLDNIRRIESRVALHRGDVTLQEAFMEGRVKVAGNISAQNGG